MKNMDILLRADIFFFITSVIVVAGGIVLVVAGIYLVKILRDISYVTGRVRKEVDELVEDVHDARNFLKKEAKRAADIKEIVGGVVQAVLGRKTRKRTPRKAKA